MTIYRDGGKGDFPRPVKDQQQYDQNWDQIFDKPAPPLKTPEPIKDYKSLPTVPN